MDSLTDQDTADASNAPEPAIVIEGAADSKLLLLCDHARNWIPPEYDALGVAGADLQRHIAFDIGAEALTRSLADRLGAASVFATYSRLLIDPNRGEDDPTLIVPESDGTPVPGNASVDDAERQRRTLRYYAPYHQAIDDIIAARMAAGRPPLIISIHSFTPYWKGMPRPWHIGVLWDTDPLLAQRLLTALAADPSIVVGDNEPYSGKAPTNSTLHRHASARNLPHVLIEIRQDLIADEVGVLHWADRLAPILREL